MLATLYIVNSSEITTVMEITKKLKALRNYVGAIHKCLKEGKLQYIKIYDFHVLMKQVQHIIHSTWKF